VKPAEANPGSSRTPRSRAEDAASSAPACRFDGAAHPRPNEAMDDVRLRLRGPLCRVAASLLGTPRLSIGGRLAPTRGRATGGSVPSSAQGSAA